METRSLHPKIMGDRCIAGGLTVAKVAKCWACRNRGSNGVFAVAIAIQRDSQYQRFLFPNTPEEMSALQEPKIDARNRVVVAPRDREKKL